MRDFTEDLSKLDEEVAKKVKAVIDNDYCFDFTKYLCIPSLKRAYVGLASYDFERKEYCINDNGYIKEEKLVSYLAKTISSLEKDLEHGSLGLDTQCVTLEFESDNEKEKSISFYSSEWLSVFFE